LIEETLATLGDPCYTHPSPYIVKNNLNQDLTLRITKHTRRKYECLVYNQNQCNNESMTPFLIRMNDQQKFESPQGIRNIIKHQDINIKSDGTTNKMMQWSFDDHPGYVPMGIPIQFLPWDGRGGAVKLELDNSPGSSDLMVTVSFTGCFIYIEGSNVHTNPIVYHFGIGDTLHLRDEAEHVFQDLYFSQAN